MSATPDPRTEYWRWADVQEGEGSADLACLVLFFLAFAVVFISFLVITSKPAWPPFNERSAGLSAATCVFGIFYCWVTLVVDDHAPSWLGGGSAADDSRLWLCWLRLILGFSVWSNCLLVRLHAISELYIKDQEPVWFVLKLLQFSLLWIVGGVLVTTEWIALSMLSFTLLISAFYAFYTVYLFAPLIARRADIPDFSATAVCTALAYLHGVWVAIAVELDLDEPTGASKGRKFVSTLFTLLLVSVHMAWTHGPLIYQLMIKQDPKFLDVYEEGEARKARDYEQDIAEMTAEARGGAPGRTETPSEGWSEELPKKKSIFGGVFGKGKRRPLHQVTKMESEP